MTLDLALVTHKPEGIRRVAAQGLPRVEGVRYVISWQSHNNEPIPTELSDRDDIEIHRFDSCGQSLNRNNAIAHCRGDIILHADDDIEYTSEGLRSVIKAFETYPDADLITFRSIHDSGCVYPKCSVRLGRRLPRNYFVAMFEIAVRRQTAGWLRCCPEFGLGSERFHGGEDEMYLMTAIRRGLNCRFFPETICTHDHPSTGTKASLTDKNLQALGCVIAFYYPVTACLRVPLKALRLSNSGRVQFFRAIRLLTRGAIAAPSVRQRCKDYLYYSQK